MSVTGHKSVQSLSVYWRVSDEEKIQMGESLGMNLEPSSASCMTAYTAPNNNTVFADTESALYEVQTMELDVVEQLFLDFNEQESTKSILRPICFNNCTVNIANVNVNMKKRAIPPEIVVSIDIVILYLLLVRYIAIFYLLLVKCIVRCCLLTGQI